MNHVLSSRPSRSGRRCSRAALETLEPRRLLSGDMAAGDLTLEIGVESVSEADGVVVATATVTRTGDLSASLGVTVGNPDDTELYLPSTVTISAGEAAATFDVEVVNDGELDGDQVGLTVSVSAPEMVAGTDSITVTDDDTPAARTLGGHLYGDVEAGTYTVLFDVEIDAGRTWTIAPGSALAFDSGVGVKLRGTLVADGEAGSEIVFTSAQDTPGRGDWAGIVSTADNQDASVLDHAEIAYATTGVIVHNYSDNPRFHIRDCHVHHNSNHGLSIIAGPGENVDGGEIYVVRSRVHDNRLHGIYLRSDSEGCSASTNAAPIAENEIYNNGTSGIWLYADNGSMYCGSAVSSIIAAEIRANYIHHNGVGIGTTTASSGNKMVIDARIINNLIVANTSHGLSLSKTAAEYLHPAVINNTIAENGGAGIWHRSDANAGLAMRNNVLFGNASGIDASGAYTPQAGAVGYNLLFDNAGGAFVNYPSSFGDLTTTNANGTPADEERNILVAPGLVGGGDYHLFETSPAVNAGTAADAPTHDYDGEPRQLPVDIGFDEVATNVAPTATYATQTTSYLVGATYVPLIDIVVTDPYLHEEITATLTLADTSTGSLTADSGNGETYDPSTGLWTITGTLGPVNTALAAAAFVPLGGNDRDTAVAVHIADGGEDGAPPVTGTITLNATAAPDVTLAIAHERVSEADGPVATAATVTRTGDVSAQLVVTVTNPDDTELYLPSTVTVAAGESSATFDIEVVNDGEPDGDQVGLSIGVSAAGMIDGADTLTVTDDDTPADRTLGGHLYGDVAAETYTVLFDVEIDAGRTWTIAPGATLAFDAGVGVNLSGALVADGEGGSEIVLTSAQGTPAPGDWAGIASDARRQDATVLSHVEIAHAISGLVVNRLSDAPQFHISDCHIHHNQADGVRITAGAGEYVDGDEIYIVRSRVHDNGAYGIHLQSYADGCTGSANRALVADNEVYHNASSGIRLYADNDPIYYCSVPVSSTVAAEVRANYIHGNDVGIDALARNSGNKMVIAARITNNLVVANTSHGLSLLKASSEYLRPTVVNNTIAHNGGAGIRHTNTTNPGFALRNNVLAGNASGIEASGEYTPEPGAVGYNLLFDNTGGAFVSYPSSFGDLTTTNTNGTPADAQRNILVDPAFIGGGDYRLRDTSLAINAGTDTDAPADDYDGEERQGPTDIGFDEVPAIVPLIGVTDSSDSPHDASVRFTTALSAFRPGVADSVLVRPAYSDTKQYVDVRNTGTSPLALFEIQINVPDVTVDVPRTSDSSDDLILQVGQTQRFQLTYAPSLPSLADPTCQSFDRADALVILSNAADGTAFEIALRGDSTFNSDISYDGRVNLGELGLLNVNYGRKCGDPNYDPTADINADCVMNLADLGPLNVEFDRARPMPLSSPAVLSAGREPDALAAPTDISATPASASALSAAAADPAMIRLLTPKDDLSIRAGRAVEIPGETDAADRVDHKTEPALPAEDHAGRYVWDAADLPPGSWCLYVHWTVGRVSEEPAPSDLLQILPTPLRLRALADTTEEWTDESIPSIP